MTEYVLGIDAGTESVRAAIFDMQGNCVGFGTGSYPTFHKHPGWAEQDPRNWEEALVKAIQEAIQGSTVDPKNIRGVGVDGTSCTVLFLNKNGEPLRPAVMWMDVRAFKEAKEISKTKHRVLKYTGFSKISPEWFPCKVKWIKEHEPDVFENSSTIFEHTDWLVYKLTGRITANINTVTIRWLFDMREGGYPQDFYELIGIGEIKDKIPREILKLGEQAGGLCREIAEQTGLEEGIPVAVGGADAYVATIGINALDVGKFALITGSSQLHIGLVNEEIHSPGIFGSFPDCLIPGEMVVEGGQISTGSVLKWFRDKLLPEYIMQDIRKSGKNAYEYLDEKVSKISPGSEGVLVLEHWQGNRTPWVDPTSRGVIRGLTLKHNALHVYRAILESVAFGTAVIFDNFSAKGIAIENIIACGGATQSDLWMQIHADAIDKPIVLTREPQAAALGSAILGAVAAGFYKSIREGASQMVSTKKTFRPNKQVHEVYKKLIREYVETYEALKDSSARMAECF